MSHLSPQQCFHQLYTLMLEQLGRVKELDDFLNELKSAIAQDDLTAINQLVNNESSLLQSIENLENQRAELLNRFGFGTDKDSFHACITWCDQGNVLKDTYTSYEQNLQQLQRGLQLNQLLVNKSRHRIRQSLHLLAHQSPAEQSTTYAANGCTEESTSKRSLAQA